MKLAVAILGGLAVGFLSWDILRALIRGRYSWTTIDHVAEAVGLGPGMPEFVSGVLAAPMFLLPLVFAVAFYLLILWLDFS